MNPNWLPSVLLCGLVACASTDAPTSQAPAPVAKKDALASAEENEPEVEVPQVADDVVVQRIVELGHTDNRVMQHVEHLAKNIGPRLTTSHNLMAAETWARDQLASWGLDARLERWGEFPVGFDRGPASGGMVKPAKVEYDFTTPAWTPGHLDPTPAPAMLQPTTVKQARQLEDQLAGAWIVRPKAEQEPTPRQKRARKKIEAILREAGIAGTIERARDPEGELVHTSGDPEIAWGKLPQDVRVVLRGDQFDELVKRLQAEEAVELSFSIDNRFFRGPVPLHNVVAEIPGTEKPDEVVIVGGHIDSWDGASGAVDNGTGVATALEAARLLMAAEAKPKRTIRFVLWSGEEQGLHGSRAYVENHEDELDEISAVFVHDGGTNYLGGISVTPDMRAQMERVFEPVTKLDRHKKFRVTHADGLQPGPSDHAPFIRAGVPAFFWIQKGKSNYSRAHHTQYDTFEHVIPEYMQHSAMVVAVAAYNVANLDELIDRRNSSPVSRDIGIKFSGGTITGVEEGGIADEAGWKAGDEIVQIGEHTMENPAGMYRTVMQATGEVEAKLRRGGKIIEAPLDFTDDPSTVEREKRREEWIERYGPDYMKPGGTTNPLPVDSPSEEQEQEQEEEEEPERELEPDRARG